MDTTIKKYKIALVCICINEPYWQYIKPMVESAKKHFLVTHDVEYLLWTDMPDSINYGTTNFTVDSVSWPYPTLLRYSLFLQQEEKLKEYDYIFYCDADMLFVDTVGDEILGEGITAAEHPMYSFRPGLRFPVEPNPDSASYIKMPPRYYAGGFQGGTSESFVKAMKSVKRLIDTDLGRNYIPIWNDESAWNRYLYDNPPSVVLSPSYVYPDSLIDEYYVKIWGCKYDPRLITLTKKFTTSKEAGNYLKETLNTL